MQLSPSIATTLACLALAAATGLAGCKHTTATDSSDAGDASDDADDGSAVDSSLGIDEDATITEDAPLGDDVPVGNCAVPDGIYTVTMTPMGDAGGSGCVPTTATVTFPLSTACSVTDQGMLPVCSITFSCMQGGMGTTTTTDGYILVDSTTASYAGYETVQVVSTAVGMPLLSDCSYGTEYAKQ